MSADDVLLKTLKIVYAAPDSGLAEDLGRLLEGSGGDEAVGAESSPCDALEHKLRCGGLGVADRHHLQTLALEGGVLVPHVASVDDVTLHVLLAVARIEHE